MDTFVIRRATVCDLRTVVGLINEAALWLRTKDTDQWRDKWPTPAGRVKRIAADITLRKTWIAWDDTTPVGTITIEHEQNPNLPVLWRPDDDRPAVSLHRVVVNRKYAGRRLGEALLEWAGKEAAGRFDVEFTRIDVWTTNDALHRYYEDIGFKFVRYHHDDSYPSGALFQRRIGDAAEVPSIALVPDPALHSSSPCGRGRGRTYVPTSSPIPVPA